EDHRQDPRHGKLGDALASPLVEAEPRLSGLLLVFPRLLQAGLGAFGLRARKDVLLERLERGLQKLRQVRDAHRQGVSAALWAFATHASGMTSRWLGRGAGTGSRPLMEGGVPSACDGTTSRTAGASPRSAPSTMRES